MCKTSSCICTKVSLGNSTCNILLQLSKGKRDSVISGVVERECIELMRERPSRVPPVNSLHRFGARFYKNAFESLHLHLYILICENNELSHVPLNVDVLLWRTSQLIC